jgi:glutamine amidotransferase
MLAVIDYGAGNLRSVLHALNALGAESIRVVRTPHELRGADKIILPGVGAFGAGMNALRDQGLVGPLRDAAFAGTPLFGICLGMQFLFETSDEMGDHDGLGILSGRVTRIPQTGGLKIPHMGWNTVHATRPSALTDRLGADAYAYFVHSYHCLPADPADVLLTTHYGVSIVAGVERGSVYGVQFHPEKSQQTGLNILAGFLERVTA